MEFYSKLSKTHRKTIEDDSNIEVETYAENRDQKSN